MSARPTVVFSAPCPTCGQTITWYADEFRPARPDCPQPTCAIRQALPTNLTPT